MTSRPVRLRPTLNVKMDLDNGAPESKKRRVGNVATSVSGINGVNGNGGSAPIRTGTGPRTRGMMELAEIDDPAADDGNLAENEADGNDSSSDSSSSESSDSSDSDESSDMDEDECDKKRTELQTGIGEIEKQFVYLREMSYHERATHVDKKFEEVKAGTAIEFINQLQCLQENMKVRVVVASAVRDYRTENLENSVDAERLSANQTLENHKSMLRDSLMVGIEEKINRLEQDRNNDFSSDLWIGTAKRKTNTTCRDLFGEKKKKPAIVSGPYIVYMLHDVDVMEDWTAIKKAAIATRRKPFASEVLAY